MRTHAGLGRNVAEGSIAVIQIHLVGRGLVHLGMAVIQALSRGASRLGIDVPAQIVHNDQVQQSVVVDIHPCPADGPERTVFGIGLVEPSLLGHVGERSVAVVVVERVVVDATHEDVLVSVVVVVANGDARVETGTCQAGLRGHIRKVALPVVLEEAVVVLRRGLLEAADVGPVGEEDVQGTVVVVVENRDAAGHGFRSVPLGRLAAIEHKPDRHVREADGAPGVLRKHEQCAGGERQCGISEDGHLSFDYHAMRPRISRSSEAVAGCGSQTWPLRKWSQGCSSIAKIRSAATSFRTVLAPDGQRTAIESARPATPSPKCSRRSFCER